MLCKEGWGRSAVYLGLLNVCPEVHSQQRCQPQPWGLPNLGKGYHVHVNALSSTGATSPLCWPVLLGAVCVTYTYSTYRMRGSEIAHTSVWERSQLKHGNQKRQTNKIKNVSTLQMPMQLWAIGMKTYRA